MNHEDARAERATSKITIVHDRQNGTIVYGTSRGDGTGPLLHPLGFHGSHELPSRSELGEPFWHLPRSDRRRHDKDTVQAAVAALRTAGRDVCVVVDDTTPATGFAEREQRRYDHAELRAERLDERAGAASAEAERRATGNRALRERMNMNPSKPGHHSERSHRADLARHDTSERRRFALEDQAADAIGKAESARAFQARRENVRTTRGRVEALDKLVAQLSEARTDLADHEAAIRAADLTEARGELEYWNGVLASSGAKLWSNADFKKGDFAIDGYGNTCEVLKVNSKSLTLVGYLDPNAGRVSTRVSEDRRYRHAIQGRTMPYRDVKGRLSAADARERFPEAFAPDGLPDRPRAARGLVTHRTAHGGEVWKFTRDGQAYEATWRHADGWFVRSGVTPLAAAELEPIRIRTAAQRLGERPGAYEEEIQITETIYYLEQLHNLVHAWVASQQAVATFPRGGRG